MSYLFPLIGGAAAIYAVMTILKLIKRKRKGNLRARIWKEFKLANQEVFTSLDTSAKDEMTKVINTTILNAEIFRNKSLESSTETTPLIRKNKNANKKVCFEIPSRSK